jgi:predicted transcriptional regulator
MEVTEMVRTQVQLSEDQARRVRQLAAAQQVSMAEIIRRSVELYVGQDGDTDMAERRRRALAVIGKYASDVPDLGRDHDKYLAEAFSQ